MNILFLTSESVPFIKTGGLADVAGSLPKALNERGMDCRVVLPLYKNISKKYKEKMTLIKEFFVDLDWKHQYCGVYTIKIDGVQYYLLDNMEYFNRDSLYGFADDCERFIFFSKACTELPKIIGFKPDIIHTNDWHTAMVNVFVDDFRRGDSYYNDIRTVFTIHNLKYQGIFDSGYLKLSGLSGSYFNENDLKYFDSINMIKGGIAHCDRLTTVSPNYAREVQYPFFGEGLDGLIRKHSNKLSGIVNGIDYDLWNPKTDPIIFENYDIDTLNRKTLNKKDLQLTYGLEVNDKIPLIGICSRLTAMKGFDLVRYIMDELLLEDLQVVVLGTGEYTYEEMFKYFERKYPKKMAARIYYDDEEAHKIYASSDFYMMPSISEPCGISQLIAMRYGSLPIVRQAGGLKDTVEPYDKTTGEGTGYSFENINAHELLFTTKRAVKIYHESYDIHKHLMVNAMTCKHDRAKSSEEYIKVYEHVKAK